MVVYSMYKHLLRLFFFPKHEWNSIANEPVRAKVLFFGLVLPLVSLLASCNFLGNWLFNTQTTSLLPMFLFSAVATFVFSLLSILLSSLLVMQFAVFENKQKRFQQAFVLISYSYAPGFLLNSIAFLFPFISYLSVFSFFVLYKGISPILAIDPAKKTGYFTFILIGLLSIYTVLGSFFIGTASLLGF